jgi:NADH:ubiquinone oxidoreductase subunit 5 (subunit L)/multisubunit Na+/H+ antiporter MnhA subunit
MRRDLGKLEGIWQAIKVDTLSIVAFQLGLFGWMALSHFVLWQPPLPVDTSVHWFMMQIGMIVGFFTAWPVNRRLVRSGIKEKMDHRKHLAAMIEQMRDERAGEDARDEPIARARKERVG